VRFIRRDPLPPPLVIICRNSWLATHGTLGPGKYRQRDRLILPALEPTKGARFGFEFILRHFLFEKV